MALFGDAVQSISGARVVGQYFTVVSFIPSTVLTSYVIILAKSGAWSGDRVDLSRAIGTLNARDAVFLGFGSLTVALALFPLQFRMIQWLEGYWGRSRPALFIAGAATARHRERRDKILKAAALFDDHADVAGKQAASPHELRALISSSEAMRLAAYYPQQITDVMPTRLGNVLRRHEITAGAVYGLDAMAVVPRILLVGDEKHTAYVRAQRTNLDLAVRTSVTAVLATAATVVFMWSHGWWLLLSLAPYTLAFAAYLGAIRAAYDYGLAFATLIDLNRFTLYERLHLQAPTTYRAEREQNESVRKMLRNHVKESDGPNPYLLYKHPKPSDPAAGAKQG